MRGLFNLNGPVIKYGNKFADLMLLSTLMSLCALPVITLGASYTAMHYVLFKIHNGEDPKVVRCFFKAFKDNFKQATIVWLIYLVAGTITTLDLIYAIHFFAEYKLWVYAFGFLFFIELLSLNWVFILISRYENSIRQMIKNSVIIGVGNLGKSIAIVLLFLLPYVPLLLYPHVIPIVILLGFSVTGLIQTKIYSRVFEKIER